MNHGTAPDDGRQNVGEHPQIKALALLKVPEGGTARGFGRGAGCAFGFGQKVHGNPRAGGNHFLDGQAIRIGLYRIELCRKDLPGFAFIRHQNAAGAGRAGVELGLPCQAFGFGLEAGFDHIEKSRPKAVQPRPIFQPVGISG